MSLDRSQVPLSRPRRLLAVTLPTGGERSRCAARPTADASRSRIARLAAALLTLATLLAGPLSARPAQADQATVIGDSIGDDMAKTVGLRTVARTSFSVRRHDIRRQLAEVPAGHVVIVSAGLNDGAAPVAHLKPFLERAIGHLEASGHRVVWMGLPCVLKKWDAAAERIDAYLAERLGGSAIQYVSLRDDTICSRAMRTGDGEHFKPKGYRYLWAKIRAEAPFAATVATR